MLKDSLVGECGQLELIKTQESKINNMNFDLPREE